MKLPRPHFSYSQLNLWEKSPTKYIQKYILGEEMDIESPQIEFGKEVALAMQSGKSKNRAIQHLLEHFKAYPYREHELTANLKIGANKRVKLLGLLDGFNPKTSEIGEYKTGSGRWSQTTVNESLQLTFYALLYYLKFKKLPKKIMLHWAETKTIDGRVNLTGRIYSFETERTKIDILKMQIRIKKVVANIEKELKKRLKELK